MKCCTELTARGKECRNEATVRVVNPRLGLDGLVCAKHARRLVESGTGWQITTT